jgi:hypothetical protein
MTTFPTRVRTQIPAGARRDTAGGAAFALAAGIAEVFGDGRSVTAAGVPAVALFVMAGHAAWRATRNVSAGQS